MRVRRLLFVVNSARFFLSHRLALARAAREAGFEVHVATPADAEAARIRAEGFSFHAVPMDRSSLSPSKGLHTIRALYRLYCDLQPSLVHHVTIKPVIFGGIAARMAGVPAVVQAVSGLGYVFSSPGIRTALVRWIVMRLYGVALAHRRCITIFQNQDDMDVFVATGLVAAQRAILIRGSGVDPDEFRPRPEPDGVPVVLFASRMLWDKGAGEFVAAARELKRRGVVARFVLAGDSDPGNPNSIPRAQLEDWARQGVVEWWGLRTDMPRVLAAAHLVCLPSVYGEGVPKILIEAAAAGRPIVATDIPGCRDIVRDGVNGLLAPPHDRAALAEAIATLVADRSRRIALGQAGPALVREGFTLSRVLDETLEVYRCLAANDGDQE